MTQLDYRPSSPRAPHSIPGIISFAASLAPIAALPYALRIGSPGTLDVVIVAVAFGLSPIAALVLGLIGMLRKNRRRSLAIIGFLLGVTDAIFIAGAITAHSD